VLKPDPRVHLPQGALDREFELARKVEAAQVQVAAALGHAVNVLNALDERLAQGGAAHGPLAAALAEATGISGSSPHPERVPYPAVPPKRVDSLQAISTGLDGLQSAVDNADADPSPDALSSYATLSGELTATLAEWTRFEQTDLAKLNAKLKAAGEPAI
jgi:hypothetical protein